MVGFDERLGGVVHPSRMGTTDESKVTAGGAGHAAVGAWFPFGGSDAEFDGCAERLAGGHENAGADAIPAADASGFERLFHRVE